MTILADVVNFNADASCLDSGRWLRALSGGHASEVCRWLTLFVRYDKKVILGFTGAGLADLAAHNPAALGIIETHPEIFSAVFRPFSHDLAPIRSRQGFAINLALGAAAVRRHFATVAGFYLPPEFMLSNQQLSMLASEGFDGVFLNPHRLASELRPRVPGRPYWLRGVDGGEMRCLPVEGVLTQAYLDSLHDFSGAPWNTALVAQRQEILIAWRDGESPFLIPQGIEREERWLSEEEGVERRFLNQLSVTYQANRDLDAGQLRSYPTPSFQAWMKEFRMIGYLTRLQKQEQGVDAFSTTAQALWLHAINSDVFSAVEKRSPVVRLREAPGASTEVRHTILRSERGFEGEEYLGLLEALTAGDEAPFSRFTQSDEPYAVKFRGRLKYLSESLGLRQ